MRLAAEGGGELSGGGCLLGWLFRGHARSRNRWNALFQSAVVLRLGV